MGFYGRVEHNSRPQFIIDKIYSNRTEMDSNINNDGVFIGRYVLVDYEQNGNKSYLRLFKKNGEQYLYFSFDLNPSTRAKFTDDISKLENNKEFYVEKDEIVYIINDRLEQEFYICSEEDLGGYAIFEPYENEEIKSNDYYNNYQTDMKNYGYSRGFDSTVWQKIFVDEKEKYVMIAELNSVVPTFDLTIDAPTTEPITPHFDADSTNVYYRLHVQPNWGFRIKPSYDEYSTDGKAIYYNADGFDPVTRSYVEEEIVREIEKIDITPTGYSGKKYNTHNPNNPSETASMPDIQDLSIILPSIGNTISNVWDIVYGKERNLDIDWDSTEGLRLVKEDGAGFSYNDDKLNTIAASINSVHDLMGMIIMETEDSKFIEAKDALINRIYYGNLEPGKMLNGKPYKSFYTKYKTYDYEESNEKSIEQIDNMKDFSEGVYYYLANDNYYVEKNGYHAGNTYYDLEGKITHIENIIDNYEANKYYYENNNNYYLEDNINPDETKTYYEINLKTMIPVTTGYKQDEKEIRFFKPISDKIEIKEDGSYKLGPYNGYFYKDKNEERYHLIENDSKYESIIGLECYWVEEYYLAPETEAVTGELIYTYDIEKAKIKIPIQFVEFIDENNYYSITDGNKNIIKLDYDNIKHEVIYYQFAENTKQKIDGLFYEKDLYYYLDEANNYIFAKEDRLIEKYKDKYYRIDSVESLEDIVFYEPDKYYYEKTLGSGDYEIDTNEKMSKIQYYNISDLYVISDENNILKPGSKWNPNITEIPNGITLGIKHETWKWKELDGFARTLNTIHGLIIEINNILKTGDKLTRDNKTVQGCINTLNDIINTFATLTPGQIAIVDKYGRLTSAPYETDKWINLQVDNGVIDVAHNDPMPLQNPLEKKDLILSFGDSFTIPEWAFDDKGHKTDSITHEIKIPEWNLEDVEHNNADIITNLSFTPTSGKLKTTRKNIVDLVLTNYELGNNSSNVEDTDTIGQAFGKTQNKINEIAAWISDEDTGAAKMKADILLNSQNIASNKLLNEANAASIEVNVADIEKNADNIEANRLAIENNNTLIKANEQVIADNKSAIEENAASIKDNKEDIDNNKRAIETINNKLTDEKITKWDQAEQNVQSDWLVEDKSADNFIKNKPDLTNLVKTDTQFNYTFGDVTTQMTIEGLLNYIASLEARIYNLENPIEEEVPPVE